VARSSLYADIAKSVEKTLAEEARRNELMLASVRTLALGLITLLNVVMYLLPTQTGWVRVNAAFPLIAAAWLTSAAALMTALRRGWYREHLRIWVPLTDGVLLVVTFANAWSLASIGDALVQRGVVVVWTMCCALIAASGGLRLRRSATVWTTAIAVAAYLVVAFVTMHPVWVLYGLSILASVGALSLWMMRIVRRAMKSELSRATLSRFLPESVLAGAYDDPLALLTEPRSLDATVLVSDLRGFTSLSEKMQPAEVFDLLNEVQGAFARAVRNEGGLVDKFLGDGMLAVFGAPEPIEDHALRAVEAAIAMRRELTTVNENRVKRGKVELRMGIGIHSGAVVTGCLGSGARLEFTVIGDTVNTASRIESLTKEHGVEVLVSEATYERIAEQSGTSELSIFSRVGQVAVRGRVDGLVVHTLLLAEIETSFLKAISSRGERPGGAGASPK
jgi:class 3 adenylate cyclase